MNKQRFALTLALGLSASALAGPAQVVHIESSSRDLTINRINAFVELGDIGGRDREYSVPYLPDTAAEAFSADAIAAWGVYQDTMYWGKHVALNNTINSPNVSAPYQKFSTSCFVNLADAASATRITSANQRSKVNLTPTQTPDSGNNRDNINLQTRWQPQVRTSDYCQGSMNFIPDDGLGAVPGLGAILGFTGLLAPGQMYMPAQATCGFWGCVTSPNFPFPSSINWTALATRIDRECTALNRRAYTRYEQTMAVSLGQNLPTAIHWNGVMTPSGVRSGTTMTPVFTLSPTRLIQNKAARLQLLAQDPALALYLEGGMDNIKMAALFPGMSPEQARAELDRRKQKLPIQTIGQQEEDGVAQFYQTWRKAETINDGRVTTYFANAYVNGVAVQFPIPLLPPPTAITPAGCVTPRLGINNIPVYGGTTTLAAPRYHYGVTSASEEGFVPNVVGSPILRVDNE